MKVDNNPSIHGRDVSSSRETGRSRPSDRAGRPDESRPAADAPANASISGRAREMARAKEVATEAADTREDKIAELKRRIAAKEYNVSPKAVADKLVDEHIS